MLHADEAVASWNGAGDVLPVTIFVFNVRSGDSAWAMVAYIPQTGQVEINGGDAGRGRPSAMQASIC